MNYEKLTLDRFKLGLKEGKYETLTGARRAIGKTTSWTAKEREAAQELANKHFGASSTVKTAAKAGAKKAAAKKTTAKAAPKKAAAAKKTSSKHENGVGATAPKTLVRTPQPESSNDYRIVAQDMLSFAANARREIEAHEQVIGSSEETKKNRQVLVGIVSNAIEHMNRSATDLPKPATSKAAAEAPRIEVPKTPKVAPPPPPSQTEVKTEANETVGEQKVVNEEDLTENERAAKQMFTQQSSGSLGLPPPQS